MKFLNVLRRWAAPMAMLLALAPLPAAMAAPVAFPTNTTPVMLDDAPLTALRNSVVYDGSMYHMWLLDVSGISRFVHATSTDGIHFTRTPGTLTPPADYWRTFACGAPAATEPGASFMRVSQVNGEWIMMVWHHFQSAHTYFNYNSSVWTLGASAGNLAPTLIGPLPSTICATPAAPGRFHVGVFGMTASRIWLRHVPAAGALPGSLGGNLGGYRINLDVSPPTTSPRPAADPAVPKQTFEANLFNGTGFSEIVTPGLTWALVHNAGRTLDQGGGVIGTYYSFADFSSSAAMEKDLWYVESADGGTSWSAPARIYGARGPQVLVDGLPNTGNFGLPEVTTNGRPYFITSNACGQRVMVTQASADADPRLAIAKQFQPAAVTLGAVSQLSITLQAPPASCSPAPATPVVSNLAFIDTLPAGLSPTGSVVSNTCTGSTVTAPANGASVGVQGVALAMGASCTVTVEVRANAVGAHENRISVAAVSNTQNLAPAQDATATLTVTAAAGSVQAVPATEPLSLAALAALLVGAAWRRRRS